MLLLQDAVMKSFWVRFHKLLILDMLQHSGLQYGSQNIVKEGLTRKIFQSRDLAAHPISGEIPHFWQNRPEMGHPFLNDLRCNSHLSIVRFWYWGSRLDVTRIAILAVEKSRARVVAPRHRLSFLAFPALEAPGYCQAALQGVFPGHRHIAKSLPSSVVPAKGC